MYVRFLVLAVLAGALVIGCGSTPASIREHLVKIQGHEEEYDGAKEDAKEKDKVAKEAKTESDKADEEARKKAEKLASALVDYAEYLRGEMEAAFKQAVELDPSLKKQKRSRDPIDPTPGGREAPAPVPPPPPAPAPVTPPAAVPDLNSVPPAPPAAMSQVNWYIKEFSYTGMRRLTPGELPDGWEFGISPGQSLDLKVKGVLKARLKNRTDFRPGCYNFAVGAVTSAVSEIDCPPGVMSQ